MFLMARTQSNAMKDFTKIDKQPINDFHNEAAAETLDTVVNEWQSGKQQIEWQVVEPAEPQELAKREKMLKFSIYSSMFSIPLGGALGLLTFDLGQTLSIVYMTFCILIVVCEYVFFLPFMVKLARKNILNATTVKINRSKKIAIITRHSLSKKMPYGTQGTIPAFRLPENNRQQYANKRNTLQQQITAETGFLFQE